MAISQKIIIGNGEGAGAIIYGGNRAAKGDLITSKYKVDFGINESLSAANANIQLDAKFDDPRYYSGDAIT
jgi:hypothetical protein